MHSRILVVDDSATELALLARMIKRVMPPGTVVDTFRSGEDAVERLKTQDYDAVVADIHLGGLSGVDVCAEAQRLHPRTRRILVTADPNLATLQSALSATRLDAYLLKRWGVEPMSAQLRRFLMEMPRE